MLMSAIKSAAQSTSRKGSERTVPPCQHRAEPSHEPCLDCKLQERSATKYRWKIILGLVFPFALQAIDSTIIASAPPWIAGDFGEFSQLNWIASAYNLTSAAFIPFWAQMADVFGRNFTLNAALVTMLIGSALCTGAPTSAFAVLLLGRGFQGLASAGLNVLVRTIIADRVSLKENAKNWSTFALVGGVSYSVGPILGGYLTKANWRWCFAINLPIAVVAMLIIFFFLRQELLGAQPIPDLDETETTGRRTAYTVRLKTIDFGGQILFICGFGLIILGFTWGGAAYPWDSAAVIASLILGILFVAAFFFWEYLLAPGNILSRMFPWQKPMIPWPIISTRDVMLLFFTEFASGMGIFAVLYFCNIYFIAVFEYQSDEAGVQLLYFIPRIGIGILICSILCNSWPRMTFVPIFLGMLVEVVGIGMLAWAMSTRDKSVIFGMMAFVGFGMGLRLMPAPLHGIGYFRKNRASVIGLLAVATPLGGTIGLTIMSTVFNNTSGLDSNTDFSGGNIETPAMKREQENMAKMGVVWAFVAITPIIFSAWIATFFLGNVELHKGSGSDEDGEQHTVTRDIFLLSLLRGNRAPDEEEKEVNMQSINQ